MIDITPYQKGLRKIFPHAIITVSFGKSISYELKNTKPMPEKEYEEAMPKIRQLFGDTLMERYTEETGIHFFIYQRNTNPQSN